MRVLFCVAVLALLLAVPIRKTFGEDVVVTVRVKPTRPVVIVPPPAPQPVYLVPEVRRQITGGAGCYGRSGCVGYQAGGCVGFAAMPVGMPYGAPRGDGTFATESGRPLPPGLLPWNGPIVGTIRAAAGYNRRR